MGYNASTDEIGRDKPNPITEWRLKCPGKGLFVSNKESGENTNKNKCDWEKCEENG
jgi:hypothetical protein